MKGRQGPWLSLRFGLVWFFFWLEHCCLGHWRHWTSTNTSGRRQSGSQARKGAAKEDRTQTVNNWHVCLAAMTLLPLLDGPEVRGDLWRVRIATLDEQWLRLNHCGKLELSLCPAQEPPGSRHYRGRVESMDSYFWLMVMMRNKFFPPFSAGAVDVRKKKPGDQCCDVMG